MDRQWTEGTYPLTWMFLSEDKHTKCGMLLSMPMARPQHPDTLHAAQAKAFERFY